MPWWCVHVQDARIVAENAARVLLEHAVLLNDTFAIEFSPQGHLRGLPDLLDGILPDSRALPAFVLRLSRAFADDGEMLWLKGAAEVLAVICCIPFSLRPCSSVMKTAFKVSC